MKMAKPEEQTVISFGEALWDLLPDGPVLGGAPLNFAYRIQNAGYRGILVSQLGSDELGFRARDKMLDLGMVLDYVGMSSEHPTGTVHIRFDEHKNPDYTIVEGVAYDFIPFDERMKSLAASAACICFGTLAQRSETSRGTLKALLDNFRGRFILCDINLRKRCYSRKTVVDSIKRCNVLKLNEEEVAEVARYWGVPASPMRAFAKALSAEALLEYCVVTLGSKGAFAVSAEGAETFQPGFQVPLKDPCGSGDAFTAGFISCLLEGRGLEVACRLGNAMGAMVAGQNGATQLIEKDALERFLGAAPVYGPDQGDAPL